MPLTIHVHQPRMWWRADATALHKFVASDPDQDDGKTTPRWPDRDHQRWAEIAAAAYRAGQQLAAGQWTACDEDTAELTIEAPEDLTKTEREIISSWFSGHEAVMWDPWFTPITNGRHRVWNSLSALPTAVLPVHGDALGYANPADAKVLGEGWHRHFQKNLDQLDGLDWFDYSDPLNARFRDSLTQAAAGKFPDFTAH